LILSRVLRIRHRNRRLAAAAGGTAAAAATAEAVSKRPSFVPFSEFLKEVESGLVHSAVLSGEAITYILKPVAEASNTSTGALPVAAIADAASPLASSAATALAESVPDAATQVIVPKWTRPVTVHGAVVDLLHANGVTFDQAVDQGWNFGPLLMIAFPLLYLGVVGALLMRYQDQTGGGDVGGRSNGGKRPGEARKRAPLTFDDVAGVDEAKALVHEVASLLLHPERLEAVGARLPTGILLVGPPGTGKTMMARAIANQTGLPFFYCAGSDFVEVYSGRGAARVRRLFEKAARAAPALVFIDEIDALGRSRSGDGGAHVNEEREQTLNSMLASMDGFASDKRVVVMAATNRYDVLDKALTRPGRFDRVVHVKLPDEKGREAILRAHIKRNGTSVDPDADLQLVAAMTPGLSGAAMAMLLNEAALCCARERRTMLTTEDFLSAVEQYNDARVTQPAAAANSGIGNSNLNFLRSMLSPQQGP
jgi:cell division protease FtsH